MPTIYLNGRYWNTLPKTEDLIEQLDNEINIDQLTDVSITAPAANDFLVYDGSNWVNEAELPVVTIAPPQTANQSRPLFKVDSDWSHLAPAFGGADISGSLLLGAADLTDFTTALPFSAIEIGTPNAHSVFLIGAQNDTDGTDDGTHNSHMILRGNDNIIRSASEGGLPTAASVKPLTIEGNRVAISVDNTEGTNSVDVQDTHTEFEKPPQLPSYTTTERDALSPNDGWMILNTTTNKIQARVNGSWVDLH